MGMVVALGAGLTVAWLAALSICDIRDHRLPNALTVPGAVVVLAVAASQGRGLAALAGAAALTAVYLAVHVVVPSGMGAGDVKLAIGLGALSGAFGPHAWMLAAFGAPALTALAGVVVGRRTLPHGPSMCAATVVAVLAVTTS